MPHFQVSISKYLEVQAKNLKEAIQEKPADGKPYVIKFYSKLPESEVEDRFTIRAEYKLINRMIEALSKEFPNIKVDHPYNDGTGYKWAEISEVIAS